ncbi:MAG TPA: hypothetical protein DEQ34_10635 [Balneolaceae bacterium]|nr:hypothetical protein [Balneolaceae bacterium]|tara:strand:- start:122537 stop:123343 length:807 start_codon:yes stop_codon:yes gene_type:complete
MDYEITSLQGSAKEIIDRILTATRSQVLIPPKLQGHDLQIPKPPDDGLYIGLFSSGSTDHPKCIWNSLERLQLNARNSADAFEIQPHHFLLMMAAPWHVAGFTWLLMAEYLECEYLFITTIKGDHKLWLQTVQDLNADYLLTVPQVLRTLYDEHWFADTVVFGGDPIQAGEFEKLSPHCRWMIQGYGQTEAGGLIAAHKRKSSLIPAKYEHHCMGRSIAGVNVRCEGEPEKQSPIYIRSESAYTDQEYRSGDLGFMDPSGRIYVTGRE